ncbi:MAG: hypothetical protein AAGD06_25700 [Acidobacteriota bacterium]
MKSNALLTWASVGLALCLALADSAAAQSARTSQTSSRLLLPLYEVEAGNFSGTTTLLAVRNESLESVTVNLLYYEPDSPQAPQRTDTITLGAKAIQTINVRDVPNLEVGPDGFARGYVIVESVGGASVLHGDYFRVTPGDAFATGYRLVDVDTSGGENELCSTFSIRFLNGGAFTGGTDFVIWIDADEIPTSPTTVSYSLYSEDGGGGTPLFTSTLPINEVVSSFSADQLIGSLAVNFGAVEFQLSGVQGHIAATMSASGLFSVGLEATCRD